MELHLIMAHSIDIQIRNWLETQAKTLQGVSKKPEQIWNCSQLCIADRGMNYLINTDYLGTYKVE